ncbi:MAG: EscU/YscU/HrcU family type III secretion system export apparatus switch protein [Treponema sp.]|nr:EscU/YscU/HrcU family type III secretion system export apparatus switch protein [Treponema sp.]
MEKQKTASAIVYNEEDPAPRLLASGRGREADRIIALAGEAGVAVVEDPALAALLDAGLRAGDIIPAWCWEAAAKILALVLAEDRKR